MDKLHSIADAETGLDALEERLDRILAKLERVKELGG